VYQCTECKTEFKTKIDEFPKLTNFKSCDPFCIVSVEWIKSAKMSHEKAFKHARCSRNKRELLALKTIHSGVQGVRSELILRNQSDYFFTPHSYFEIKHEN
jgi:hypothetical protein